MRIFPKHMTKISFWVISHICFVCFRVQRIEEARKRDEEKAQSELFKKLEKQKKADEEYDRQLEAFFFP